MSAASRAYCQRRLEDIDRRLAERRGHVGPTGPMETPDGIVFSGYLGRLGPGENVDDLLELRVKWMALLERQS
jgi:hypothetical protein